MADEPTLNESAINTRDLLREWSLAHDALTDASVPVGEPDGPLWSLPSRVRWLTAQPFQREFLAEDLRRILDDFDRRNRRA